MFDNKHNVLAIDSFMQSRLGLEDETVTHMLRINLSSFGFKEISDFM